MSALAYFFSLNLHIDSFNWNIMAEKSFSDIGRIEAIKSLYEGTPYKPFESCWFETASKAYVTTQTRIFLEGIDFDLVYFPLKHLGYKAVVATTGELFAELSQPRTMDIKLGLSSKLDFVQVRELWSGIIAAAKEFGYSKVGLDLVPSRNGLTIAVSANGETSVNVVRPKAESKDLICVSGSLGAAFFGQQVLERAKGKFDKDGTQPDLEKHRMMVAAYLKPELNPNLLVNLDESKVTPSFGYLVTKGLADAVKRLVRDSGLGAKIYAQKIPFEGNSFDLGKELDIDPISAAMNGGEDYKILFTIPISQYEKFRHDFQTFDIVGHLALPDVGAVMVTPDGAELPLRAQGWVEENED